MVILKTQMLLELGCVNALGSKFSNTSLFGRMLGERRGQHGLTWSVEMTLPHRKAVQKLLSFSLSLDVDGNEVSPRMGKSKQAIPVHLLSDVIVDVGVGTTLSFLINVNVDILKIRAESLAILRAVAQ